ncbi:MAG: hypothetical protein ACI38Q_02520 [Candidatus Bruticola sp.]
MIGIQNALDCSAGFSSGVCRNVMEVYFTFDPNYSYTNSVLGAGGYLKASAENINIKSAQSTSAPRIHSLRDMDLNYSNIVFDNGEAVSGGKVKLNDKEAKFGQVTGSNFSIIKSSDEYKDDIARIKWDDVTKADTSKNYETREGGIYVWKKNSGENSGYTLSRYDSDPNAEVKKKRGKRSRFKKQNNVAHPVSSSDGFTIDTSNATIIISNNIKVNGPIEIRYDDSCSEITRPVVAFIKNSPTDNDPILSANGNVSIQGATLGSGSITSERSVSLQGPSILESDPGLGVSVYAKEDVNFLPIDSATQAVQEQNKNIDFTANAANSYFTYDSDNDTFNGAVSYLRNKLHSGSNCDDIADSEVEACLEHYLYQNYAARIDPPEGTTLLDIPDPDSEDILGDTEGKKAKINSAIEAAIADNEVNLAVTHYCNSSNWITCYQAGYGDENPANQITIDNNLEAKKAKKFVDDKVVSENFRDYKQQQLNSLLKRYGQLRYSDQDISGMIYAWRNINVDIGENSTLNVNGAMVAYGQDPSKGGPEGNSDRGNIKIKANTIGLTLDADYMNAFMASNARRKLMCSMYNNF